MAYPFEHYLLAFGGTLFTQEQWSCTLRLGGNLGANQDVPGEVVAMNNLATSLSATWKLAGAPIMAGAPLTYVKYNRIGVDGKYVRNTTNVKDLSPTAVPAFTSQPLPPQMSLVLTLETNISRGLAAKGRIFLPAPKGATGTLNALTAADTTAAATWGKALIDGVNAAQGSGDVVVASSVRTGAMQLVTGVNVGSIFDTMRSRRGKFLEVRARANVVNSGVGGSF